MLHNTTILYMICINLQLQLHLLFVPGKLSQGKNRDVIWDGIRYMIMWILFAIRQRLKVKCIHGYADSVCIMIEFGTDV